MNRPRIISASRSLRALTAEDRQKLARVRDEWDRDLEPLGGDPSAFDWSTFRPLRREREEDWSDWLAQLIANSKENALAWYLFGPFEGCPRLLYVQERIEREFQVEDRRADLVFK